MGRINKLDNDGKYGFELIYRTIPLDTKYRKQETIKISSSRTLMNKGNNKQI